MLGEEIARLAHLAPPERIAKALGALDSWQQCSDVSVWEGAVCLQAEGIPHDYVRAFCCGGRRFCLFSDAECCPDDDAVSGLVTRRHCRFVVGGAVRSVYVYDDSVSLRMNRRYVLHGLLEDGAMHLLRHVDHDEGARCCPLRDVLSPLLSSRLATELLSLTLAGSTTQRQSGILDSLLIGSTSLNVVVPSAGEASALAESLASLLSHHGRLIRLSLASLNCGDASWLPLLDTETGILHPSLLQLPHDAVLVVDESGLEAGAVGGLGLARLSALQTLATHQRLDIAQGSAGSGRTLDHAALEATLPSISLPLSNPVVVISSGAASMLTCALTVRTAVGSERLDENCRFWKPACVPAIDGSLADAIHADYLQHRALRDGQKQDENGQRLDGNGQRLDENGQRLDGNGQRLDGNGQRLDENGLALALNLMRMHVSLRRIEGSSAECSWEDWCYGRQLALDYLSAPQ